jgi:hypothetical protein
MGISLVEDRSQEVVAFTREIRRLRKLLWEGHDVDEASLLLLLYSLQDLLEEINGDYSK